MREFILVSLGFFVLFISACVNTRGGGESLTVRGSLPFEGVLEIAK